MLDIGNLRGVLDRLDRGLKEPATLCLIGSGATILMGQERRMTEDLDAWARACRFEEVKMRQAAEEAGLSWDPRDEFPKAPYIQFVHPGIVQVPGWNPAKREWLGRPEEVVWSGKNLIITVPPAESIIASKLVRGDDTDLEDCLWLMSSRAVEARSIVDAVREMPSHARAKAKDNLDLLLIMKKFQR